MVRAILEGRKLITASMPSGVEQILDEATTLDDPRLITASMPSGVEQPQYIRLRAVGIMADHRLDAFGR